MGQLLFSNNRKKRLFFLCCYISFAFHINAQKHSTNDLSVTLNYNRGFIIPEYSNLLYLVNEGIQAASISISKKTTGKNYWEQLYNYPEYGVSLFYTTLGNDQVNGREFGLFPFFRLNIISKGHFCLYNQTGIGMSYVTRKFDLKNNYLNVAVGSNLNIHFNFKIGVSYQVLKKMQLQLGLAFDHLSNGNLSEPNLGLNSLTFYSGIGYLIGQQSERVKYELKSYEGDHRYELIYSFGGKHPRSLNSKFYFTSSATFEYKWEPLRVIHFGVGADLFYDTSTEAEMSAGSTAYKTLDDFTTGIHLSQEFVYNRLSLIIQEGLYMLLTDQVNHYPMYNRGIVRYRPTERFFCQIAMKSHLNILDYPELGLGLRW